MASSPAKLKTTLSKISESRGGKFIQRIVEKIAENPEQSMKMALMAALAYMGYASYRKGTAPQSVEGAIGNIIVGPIYYQMAISPGGSPPVIKVVGALGLAGMGLSFIDVPDAVRMFLEGILPNLEDTLPDNPNPEIISDEDFKWAQSRCLERGYIWSKDELDACTRKRLTEMGYVFNDRGEVLAVCPFCGAAFTSPKTLDVHIAGAHPEEEDIEPPYVCPECGARFWSNRDMQLHRLKEHYS